MPTHDPAPPPDTPSAAPAVVPTEAAAAPAAVPEASAPGAAPPAMGPADCARVLRQRFPALFGDRPLPLKLRIQADIQARAPGVFTKKALSAFLHRYTGSTAYLQALSRSTQRFDLDGQAADALSEEHRAAAAAELQRRRAVHEARRAAEDGARRERALLLRAFETTTLTRANFCALKGVADAELDALLAQAREEATAGHPARPGGPPGEGRGPRRGPAPRGPGGRDDRPRPTSTAGRPRRP